MLLLLASVIGFLHGRGEGYAGLSRQILELLPFSSEYMANAVERVIRARRSLGFFGSVLLIWSATAAFDVLQQILNRIHRAPAMRPLWRRRLLGLLLGLIVLLFLPLSIGISASKALACLARFHEGLEEGTVEQRQEFLRGFVHEIAVDPDAARGVITFYEVPVSSLTLM